MERYFQWHSYILPFIICLLATLAIAKHSIISDQNALLSLKNHITLDLNQIITKNWSTQSSVCSWIGVSCGLHHYRVTALNISNMGLTGTIAPQLGNISFLTSLDLSRNNFHGELPSELVHLRRLKFLSLSENGFSGEFPTGVGSLNLLQSLILNNNSFTGSIPSSISNLTNLKYFICYQNELSGSIPYEIFNISSLEALAFEFNYLYGNLPNTMCTNLQKLIFISIRSNMLSGFIPSDLTQCSQLTTLVLSQNNFTGKIPKTFWNMKNLERASFRYNNLVGMIAKDISNFSTLQSLTLSNNHLTGHGISAEFPSDIGNLNNLLQLDLGQNKFIGPLPTTIALLQNLQYLDLGYNRLSGMLSCDIFSMQHLSELYLQSNNFYGSIPECIGNTTSLRKLNLGANNLGSTIPMALWNLNGLLMLNLSKNFLSGSLSNKVGNMESAILLDLSMNRILGYIPNVIGSLVNLEELYLSYNLIQGLIPESIRRMVSLEKLDLSKNNLSGSIPIKMENLKYLNEFNVSHNNLVGLIPYGGPFKKFTWESFIFNKGLCGEKNFHVPPCPLTPPKKIWTHMHLLILCFGLMSIVVVITLVVAYIIFRRKVPFQQSDELQQVTTKDRISFYELQKATNRYDERNLLGKGSFGSVYKGTLRYGLVVAIKVFDIQEERALKSFDVECEMLRNLQHRNLTHVISSCSNQEFKAIILEYMPNGSLENWLHSENHFLSFVERLNIMIDVSYALQYLHLGYPTPVVHADLKPSNVLLDEDKVAHVCDFGIAKMLGENRITYTNTLATFGYIAPEYGSQGLVSTKCDVYSFGILLMEVFTGKRPNDEMFNESLTLHSWVNNAMNINTMIDIIDDSLLSRNEEMNFVEMLDCGKMIMNLALNCTKEFPKERSSVEEIIATLSKNKLKL